MGKNQDCINLASYVNIIQYIKKKEMKFLEKPHLRLM